MDPSLRRTSSSNRAHPSPVVASRQPAVESPPSSTSRSGRAWSPGSSISTLSFGRSRRDFVIPGIAKYASATPGRGATLGYPEPLDTYRILASRDGPGSALRWMEAPVGVGWVARSAIGVTKALRGDRLGRRTASHR